MFAEDTISAAKLGNNMQNPKFLLVFFKVKCL